MTADNPLPWTLAGEAMELHGTRALYWPAQRRLLIADLHLGKGDAFRHGGIALPRGGTAHDLDRLSAVVARTGARSLWVLGDLLHGALTDTAWRADWEAWRHRHAALDIVALAGNHDRALARAGLALTVAGPHHDEGPFRFCHDPAHAVPGRHTVCGHLHPVAQWPGVPRRWPLFWLQPDLSVLPAFSAFTGGLKVAAAAHTHRVACVEGAALLLPAFTPRPHPTR
jgi:DNA ligase-associated metallophosphoesterase